MRGAFNVFQNGEDVLANFEGVALPYGYYRFRVQAINRATADQTSSWSPWSRVFGVYPPD